MIYDRWPAPHPELGEALTIQRAAALLGIGANAIDVQLNRTRAGTARVPFPEPNGDAPLGNGYRTRFWWQVHIERYRRARTAAGGGRRVFTDAQIAEIRRLHSVDGLGVNVIARRTGITIASVSRIVNNKAHVPKDES